MIFSIYSKFNVRISGAYGETFSLPSFNFSLQRHFGNTDSYYVNGDKLEKTDADCVYEITSSDLEMVGKALGTSDIDEIQEKYGSIDYFKNISGNTVLLTSTAEGAQGAHPKTIFVFNDRKLEINQCLNGAYLYQDNMFYISSKDKILMIDCEKMSYRKYKKPFMLQQIAPSYIAFAIDKNTLVSVYNNPMTCDIVTEFLDENEYSISNVEGYILSVINDVDFNRIKLYSADTDEHGTFSHIDVSTVPYTLPGEQRALAQKTVRLALPNSMEINITMQQFDDAFDGTYSASLIFDDKKTTLYEIVINTAKDEISALQSIYTGAQVSNAFIYYK